MGHQRMEHRRSGHRRMGHQRSGHRRMGHQRIIHPLRNPQAEGRQQTACETHNQEQEQL